MRPKILIPGNAEYFRNYAVAVGEAGGEAVFTQNRLTAPECHGLLLPGGGDVEPWRYGQKDIACRNVEPCRDALEFFLAERFLQAGRPILGICRGMQLLNVLMGGTLRQDIPGHGQTGDGTDRLHKTRVESSFLSVLYGQSLIVNSAHHQTVEQLGEELRAVQWAPDGTVEALEHESLPVWGVQWHPERLRGAMQKRGAADGSLLFRGFVEQCKYKRKKLKKDIDR